MGRFPPNCCQNLSSDAGLNGENLQSRIVVWMFNPKHSSTSGAMTRLEKIINAVNRQHPGVISPIVARHLIEMEEIYKSFVADNELERVFSRNGVERRGDLYRPTVREERLQIILRLADYQKSRGLNINSLAAAIFAKTGHRVNWQSLHDWFQNTYLPTDRSAKLIQKFLDAADDQSPDAETEPSKVAIHDSDIHDQS